MEIQNKLEKMFASPKNHPTTCANPAPWKIIELRIEINPVKIWIRGDDSMWFRADQCDIGSKSELTEYHDMNTTDLTTEQRQHRQNIRNAYLIESVETIKNGMDRQNDFVKACSQEMIDECLKHNVDNFGRTPAF